MQSSLEIIGTIGRKMTIIIPSERLEDKVVERLKSVTHNARLPGFRPGKAPRKLIDAKYGPQVVSEVAEQLINEGYREAVTENKIIPAGSPRIEAKKIERGSDLEFVAEFDVFPEILKTNLEGETITNPVCSIGDDNIQNTIDSLRQRQVKWEETEDASADGDKVTIDFVGKIDGEVFEGGEATDFDLVLGSGSMLPDFEAALFGVKKDDVKTVDVDFPDDYPGEVVAGKTSSFNITVKSINHPILPPLDDEFVKSLGVAAGTPEALDAEVRKNLERELNDRIRMNVKTQVMDKMAELNPIDVPQQMVEEELTRMVEQTTAQYQQQGMKDVPIDKEQLRPQATRRVALGLIMSEVIQGNEIKLDEDKLRARVDEMSTGYEKPEEFVQWHYADRSRLASMEALVLEDQVVQFLVGSATSEDKEVDFKEFTSSQA